MSTVVSVWSKVILPGEDTLVTEDVALQITNITLEVDEASTSKKRSVLKMQHLEAEPALLRAASGYDLASDSEYDDDSEIDSDEFDDEEDEDDEEMEADTSKVSKASTSSKANGKVNGKPAEEEDDEDDEDDEEDEDEEDFDFDREEHEVQICSFIPGQFEQFSTNLTLPAGEDFVFKNTGDHKIHLFGHYIVQPVPGQFDEPPSDYDSDEEYDSDEMSESELDMYDPETGLLLEDDDSEEEAESSKIMEIEEEPAQKPAKKEADKPAAAAAAAPAAATEAAADKTKLSKNQLKKQAKKEAEAAKTAAAPAKKEEAAKPAAAAAAAAPQPAKKAPSKKQTLPSGLVIEDNKTGSGPTATSGKRVQMRYIGRLQNGKIFDQNTKGAPFSFKLGKGEVIKGWDEGIQGMQVGGERRLVIPPGLAYGKQAISGIPANSTLTFEVKLLAVK